MVVALDFTGSNGNPALPGTLHYCLPNQPGSYQMNPYEQTVLGLAPVLEQVGKVGHGPRVAWLRCDSFSSKPLPRLLDSTTRTTYSLATGLAARRIGKSVIVFHSTEIHRTPTSKDNKASARNTGLPTSFYVLASKQRTHSTCTTRGLGRVSPSFDTMGPEWAYKL